MTTLITAVVRPHAVDAVKQALKAAGVTGMTVTEVKGVGRQGGLTETYRGAEYTVEFIPKVKVEILVPDDAAVGAVEAIAAAARTDKIGDGKIWTAPVGSIMRIRTGELGDDAV